MSNARRIHAIQQHLAGVRDNMASMAKADAPDLGPGGEVQMLLAVAQLDVVIATLRVVDLEETRALGDSTR